MLCANHKRADGAANLPTAKGTLRFIVLTDVTLVLSMTLVQDPTLDFPPTFSLS